jgi:NADH dehydrogenase FAD-containing subunit
MNFLPSPTITNTQNHFAVGDIASWSGIKRCGAAMAMGHIAAVNIHQQLLQQSTGKLAKFLEFPHVSPMIALAVGKEAVMYGEESGTTCGKAEMEMMFGQNLGFDSLYSPPGPASPKPPI